MRALGILVATVLLIAFALLLLRGDDMFAIEPETPGEASRAEKLEQPLVDANARTEVTAESTPSATAIEVAREDAPDAVVTATASLRGLLVDVRTDEPIPSFYLEVWLNYERVGRATSDAEGRFVIENLPAGEEIAVVWMDDPEDSGDYGEVELALAEGDEAERRFALKIGPTYRLMLDLPAGLRASDFKATVAASTERGHYRSGRGWAIPVRDGVPPWVRFDEWSVRGQGATAPWSLDLVSEDGLHHGVGEVESIVGIHERIVPVQFERTGVLAGTVASKEGKSVKTVWITLDRDGSRNATSTSIREDGTFGFRALEPGEWVLTVNSPDHVTWTRAIEVAEARERSIDVVLEEIEADGVVSGRVVSETGDYRGEATIALWGWGENKSNKRLPLQWEEADGRWVAPFSFENVHEGEFELHYVARDCPFDILPDRKQVVTTNQIGLEFVIHDDVAVSDLAFRVVDDLTGDPFEEIGVWWWSDTAWAKFHRSIKVSDLLIESWPDERSIFYAIRVDGFAAAYGTQLDFEQDGSRRVADVRLRKGWGAQFFLSEPGSQDGLEGITLSFDGAEVGPSGVRGKLSVSLAERPRRIEVVTPGWRLAGGNVDPEDGSFDDETWWAVGIDLERVD